MQEKKEVLVNDKSYCSPILVPAKLVMQFGSQVDLGSHVPTNSMYCSCV